MSKPRIIAFDTETTGLSPWNGDRPYALSICTCDGDQYYADWDMDPFTRKPKYRVDRNSKRMLEMLCDPDIEKVGHNSSFDYHMMNLCELPCRVQGPVHDTMITAHVFNNMERSRKLKDLAQKYCGIDNDDEKALHDATKKARLLLSGRNRWEAKRRKLPWKGLDPYDYAWTWKPGENVATDMWLPKTLLQSRDPYLVDRDIPDEWEDLCEVYCRLDSERTMLLWLRYEAEFAREDTYRRIYAFEHALWPVVRRIEERGMRIKPEEVDVERNANLRTMRDCEQVLFDAYGSPFNLNSNKEIQTLVYDKLGIPVTVETDTGQPSTSSWTLQYWIDNPVIEALFRYRSAEKAIGTFLDKYRDKMIPDTVVPGEWVIHTDFNQIGAATGRFTCRNPNLQQTAEAQSGRALFPIQARTPFGPREGYVWYSIDYSQLEVRIFAALSHEPTMLRAIANDDDLHSECTNKVWGGRLNPSAVVAAIDSLELELPEPQSAGCVKHWNRVHDRTRNMSREDAREAYREYATLWLEEFDWDLAKAEKSLGKKNYRNRAKMIMFTKLYGGGANAIALLLKEQKSSAAKLLREYDAAFPELSAWCRAVIDEASEYGYTTTAIGRRLWVAPGKAYTAVNYKIQGSATDQLKRAMIKTDQFFRDYGIDGHLVMTLHDELIFEIRKGQNYKWVLRGLATEMMDHDGVYCIPLPVDIERSVSNWDAKKEVKL